MIFFVVNIFIYANNETETDILKNGINLHGPSYSVISIQNITDINSAENSTNIHFDFNIGVKIIDYFKFMILMPGLLWEPINFDHNERLYIGNFTGITSYSLDYEEDIFIHKYNISSINQLSYLLGNSYKLNMSVPITFVYTSETYPNYKGLYKYSTISTNIELEKFIFKNSSIALSGIFTYLFSLTEYISVNNNYLLLSRLKLNLENKTFFNVGLQIAPETSNGDMVLLLSLERRL